MTHVKYNMSEIWEAINMIVMIKLPRQSHGVNMIVMIKLPQQSQGGVSCGAGGR